MKLLLTSCGITNPSLAKALLDLIGKPFSQSTLAYIPTAANVEEGDKGWLIDDLERLKNLKFQSVDIVDISALPQDIWLPRLKVADVLVFGGGNTFHLLYWLEKSGLKDQLAKLLESKVYVGISAGSMVATPSLALSQSQKLYYDKIGQYKNEKALGLVKFQVRPHLNSPHFPNVNTEFLANLAKEIPDHIIALDDNSAVKVVDGSVEIVSEGEYAVFN